MMSKHLIRSGLATLALVTVCAAPLAFAEGATLNLGAMNPKSNDSSSPATAATAPQSQCKIKATGLANIGQVINEIQQGKKSIEPLILTPAQLLSTNPAVLKQLKSHYEVITQDCEVVPVVGGQLASTVQVNFATLANGVAKAIRNDDKDRLKYLITNFQAAPVTSQEGLNLISIAPYGVALQEKMASVLGLPSYYPSPEGLDVGNKVILMSSIFDRLGGKVRNPATLNVGYSGVKIACVGQQTDQQSGGNPDCGSGSASVAVAPVKRTAINQALTNLGYTVQNSN